MTKAVYVTHSSPRFDAWNKERLLEGVVARPNRERLIPDAQLKRIVEQVNPEKPRAALAFLRRLKKINGEQLGGRSYDLRDLFERASDAYRNISDPHPATAGVFGLELAAELAQWNGAHQVIRAARALKEDYQLGGALETKEAEAVIEQLTPKMRAFAAQYDAMLRGEKAVSDVIPKATLFALFPSLIGKDLPTLHEALADVIAGASEGLLVGMFNHRWLQNDTCRELHVNGPLRGDLNEFVAWLKHDAKALRNGVAFGPSRGYGQRGTNPMDNYLRGTQEAPEEGFGLLPTFLQHLALPAYRREDFTFGDAARASLPTFAGIQSRPTVDVQARSDGLRIVVE